MARASRVAAVQSVPFDPPSGVSLKVLRRRRMEDDGSAELPVEAPPSSPISTPSVVRGPDPQGPASAPRPLGPAAPVADDAGAMADWTSLQRTLCADVVSLARVLDTLGRLGDPSPLSDYGAAFLRGMGAIFDGLFSLHEHVREQTGAARPTLDLLYASCVGGLYRWAGTTTREVERLLVEEHQRATPHEAMSAHALRLANDQSGAFLEPRIREARGRCRDGAFEVPSLRSTITYFEALEAAMRNFHVELKAFRHTGSGPPPRRSR